MYISITCNSFLAKSTPGGRIQTQFLPRSSEHGAYPSVDKLELGAQWIHGEENDLCKLAKSSGQLHSKTSWEGKGMLKRSIVNALITRAYQL